MRNQNQAGDRSSKNRALNQGKAASGKVRSGAGETASPGMEVWRDIMRLATKLEMKTGRAAALMQSLAMQLFLLTEAIPGYEQERLNVAKLAREVAALAEDLDSSANGLLESIGGEIIVLARAAGKGGAR